MHQIFRATDTGSSGFRQETVDAPTTRLATREQRRLAATIAFLLAIATAAILPFASQRLPMLPAFFPAYQSAVIGTYLITAYLMFGQYQATRAPGLLHLAAGCIYTAVMLVMQLVAYPGAFVDNVRIVGGTQTITWLWFFWHLGPAVSVLLFAWSESRNRGKANVRVQYAVFKTAIVLLIALAVTVGSVTVFHAELPVMDIDGDFSRVTSSGIAPGLQLLLVIALAALWKIGRFQKVMHIWLALTLVALICDNTAMMFGANRLSVGWYAGRFCALISSCVMMFVYLHEIKRSYLRSTAQTQSLTVSNETLSIEIAQAMLDGLTKLPSRELFLRQAEALRKTSIEAEVGFATLFIDLDDFKAINDTYGHDHGDLVLVQVAAAVKSVLRDSDVAGRLGGDEFVVCLGTPPEMTLAIANKIAGRIIDKIAAIGFSIGASVGISICKSSLDLALHEADEAMYDSKHAGKNQFKLHRAKPILVWSA